MHINTIHVLVIWFKDGTCFKRILNMLNNVNNLTHVEIDFVRRGLSLTIDFPNNPYIPRLAPHCHCISFLVNISDMSTSYSKV